MWRALRDGVNPPPGPRERPWRAPARDPCFGEVELTGALAPHPRADTVAVIVHGLGGSAESGYCLRAAAAAESLGLASLRLHLRGADRSGEGLYHAGLVGDLEAAIASPEIAAFPRVVVIGFSLGGHLALHLALSPPPGVVAVAALCSPLNLEATCRAIDTRARAPYRRYLLRGLLHHYQRVAARREVPLPWTEARRIRRLREWDDAIIAPLFGFAGASDYYARTSVGPSLADLKIPALYLLSADDPIIPASTSRPSLATRRAFGTNGRSPPSPYLEIREAPVGHVGFTDRDELGLPGPPGPIGQVLRWLVSREPAAARSPAPARAGCAAAEDVPT